jgi:uncharacterized membrane protein
MGYMIMKLVHILFVVIFLGNIIISVFWKRHGDKSNNPLIMAHTISGIIKADRRFTVPGVAGLAIFGFGAQGMAGIPIMTPWIFWSVILFVISGAAFMGMVVPIQKKLLAIAQASVFNKEEYSRLTKQWELWGSIATITPIIAVVLMVVKPI